MTALLDDTTARPARSQAASYLALTKPRIIELLLVTTVPTMVLAQRGLPPLGLVVATVAGGALAAGGANALNMVIDRDIDTVMERTQGRPLVTGEVTPGAALVFALALEVAAAVVLGAAVNVLSAALALAATAFYVGVYTLLLKRTSSQNIVIGGAAGAVPVLVGWTAVTGHLAVAPLLLFAVIFLWTPPHFWALAIRYRRDYRAAGVPMLPAVVSERRTAARILGYTLVMAVPTLVLGPVAHLGPVYLAVVAALDAGFVVKAAQLLRHPDDATAIGLFKYSISYLSLLFVAIAVIAAVRG